MQINRRLFKRKRKDPKQEKTRLAIVHAFEELDKNPEKYGKPFKTMILGVRLRNGNIRHQEEFAKAYGDHMGDMVEQALEWAQRIFNGESWKKICNESDTAKWYRLVKDGNGYVIIGGSREDDSELPLTNIEYYLLQRRYDGMFVPLVIFY